MDTARHHIAMRKRKEAGASFASSRFTRRPQAASRGVDSRRTYFLNLESTPCETTYHSRPATLEEWVTVAKQGGHTAKLRELLERLHHAISLFCLGIDAGLPAPKPPVDWFYRNLDGQVQIVTSSRTHFLSEYTSFLLEHNGVSAVAHKLTKHEDPRVAQAATAVCDYWCTLFSVLAQVPKPPPPPPAPVSKLPSDFLATSFANDSLAHVLESMSPRMYVGMGPYRVCVDLDRRIRDIARVQSVCKTFRDAGGLVLAQNEEAAAVTRAILTRTRAILTRMLSKHVAKREAEEAEYRRRRHAVMMKVAKARAERERKETVERAIRYVEESAKRKPEALTEATACPEVKNLRRHFRKGRLSELKMELREEEARARDEARKACAVGRYHDRRWSDYLRWSGFLRSDPLDYMW